MTLHFPLHPRKQEFKKLFEASGWSQAELGRRLGITRGGVNGIITGNTVPEESTLKHLKLILLMEGETLPSVVVKTSAIEARLASLSEDEREEVLELFNAIVEQALQRAKKRRRQ